jgi:hypothetical protein
MTPSSVPLALVLVTVVVLLVVGCAAVQTGDGKNTSNLSIPITNSMPSITATPMEILVPHKPITGTERKVFTVIQGDPFTYRGFVNNTDIHSIDVLVKGSKYMGSTFLSVPVNADGTFAFTLGGNLTKEFWDDYTYLRNYSPYNQANSPYLHICLNNSTTNVCFDLLLVQEAKDLPLVGRDRWILIDSFQNITIPPEAVSDYTGPFFVNGTTNLPTGENLSIELSSLCFWPCPKRESTVTGNIGCCGDVGSHVEYTTVQERSDWINTWSFLVNTTPDRISISRENGLIDDTNRLQVYVSSVNRTEEENGWDCANFVVKVTGIP